MNATLEKRLVEVMRAIAAEDADYLRNADHETLVSLAQGNIVLGSVSVMEELLDTFKAQHNRLAENVLAERGFDGDGVPLRNRKIGQTRRSLPGGSQDVPLRIQAY